MRWRRARSVAAGFAVFLAAGLTLAARPAAGQAGQPLLAPPVVQLEQPEHLSRFFAALTALERPPAGDAAPARRKVRVTQLGDSHIAADMLSGRLRATLQARFGDGGRGFVLPGKPWRSYWQGAVNADMIGEWRVDLKAEGRDDGALGPGNCAAAASDPEARITVGTATKGEVGRALSTLDVYFVRQGDGGCFEVREEGALLGRVGTRGAFVEPDRRRFQVPDGPHRFVISPLDAAVGTETRLLGFSLERAEGLVWDALGINGALAKGLVRNTPEALSGVLTRLDPTLLTISFGTNELFDGHLTMEAYAQQLAAVLGALRRAAPGADCLLTGPFDALKGRRPPPNTDALIAVQRTQAFANGCAYFDARAAMGGAGSIRAWRRAGLAQRDFVHLTRPGYERVADLLAEAILYALAVYQMPPGP